MPLPLILAGLGAAAAGAYAYSKLRDSDDDYSYEDSGSKNRNRLNKASSKLKLELQSLEQATQHFNEECIAAERDSKLGGSAIPVVKGYNLLTAGALAIDYVDCKFQALLKNKLNSAYSIKESAKAFRKGISPHAAIIEQAATTLAKLLTCYRKDRARNQHLIGAIRLLLTYNQVLMLVPVFDPKEDLLSTNFKFNSKFEWFTQVLKFGLNSINELYSELDENASAVVTDYASNARDDGKGVFCYNDTQNHVVTGNKASLTPSQVYIRAHVVPVLREISPTIRDLGKALQCLNEASLVVARQHGCLLNDPLLSGICSGTVPEPKYFESEALIHEQVIMLNEIMKHAAAQGIMSFDVYKLNFCSRLNLVLKNVDRELKPCIATIERATKALELYVGILSQNPKDYQRLAFVIMPMLRDSVFMHPLALFESFEAKSFDSSDVNFANFVNLAINRKLLDFTEELKVGTTELNNLVERLYNPRARCVRLLAAILDCGGTGTLLESASVDVQPKFGVLIQQLNRAEQEDAGA